MQGLILNKIVQGYEKLLSLIPLMHKLIVIIKK